jgi:hypothetical protein
MPSKRKPSRPYNHSESDLAKVGFWAAGEREKMDACFAEAMQQAIERGQEHAITAISTAAGTRCPKAGYQRPD